jgi:hypothetical protein
MIHFWCPRCNTLHESPEQNAGQKLNCSSCGQRLQVPEPLPPLNKTVLGKLDELLPQAKLSTDPIPAVPLQQVPPGAVPIPAAPVTQPLPQAIPVTPLAQAIPVTSGPPVELVTAEVVEPDDDPDAPSRIRFWIGVALGVLPGLGLLLAIVLVVTATRETPEERRDREDRRRQETIDFLRTIPNCECDMCGARFYVGGLPQGGTYRTVNATLTPCPSCGVRGMVRPIHSRAIAPEP